MAEITGAPSGNQFSLRTGKTSDYSTSKIPTRNIGHTIDEIVRYEMIRRKGFERRWYDNNFFDDGFHFRFLSRSTNKIVDLSERSNIYTPQRALPKASRQIRGVTNLLVSNDPTPVVYPDHIDKTQFPNIPQQQLPQQQMTGQQFQMGQPGQAPQNQPASAPDNPLYTAALAEAKRVAQHTGYWLEEEFKSQELTDKIALMVLLTSKHSVSWIKIWPDSVKEVINSQVRDAFDVIVRGTLTDPYDSPYMIEIVPTLINEIKANKNFDPEQLAQISPDNRQASSEIKEAYMNARYNKGGHIDSAATLLLKEAYLKEYLSQENMERIRNQDDGDKILKGKKEGDMVIRQVFVAANVWLRDRYVNLPEYPFVDYRMEPGNIYQIPLIERFIPMNKTLDTLVSRAERYANAMVTGTWLKRAGEQFSINNIAGGQVIEYAAIPPTQAEIQPIPQFFFELIQYISGLIEEQGTTTSTLSKVPPGVKANAAIESLKESEFANLVMANRRLKTTVKRIAERFLDIADHHFITPKTVYYIEKGNPKYFDVIGHSALKGRKALKAMDGVKDDIVPIKGDSRVDIEIESGQGFTKEGQKATMMELFNALVPFVEQGFVPPEPFKVALERLLETYQFGATAEFMEAWDESGQQSGMDEQTLLKIKTALLEALQDAGEVGKPASDKRVQESSLGALQALKDTGLANGQPQDPKMQAEIAAIQQKMQQDKEEHDMKMAEMRQELQLKSQEAQVDNRVKAVQASHSMGLKEQQTQAQIRINEKMANQPQPKGENGSSKSKRA